MLCLGCIKAIMSLGIQMYRAKAGQKGAIYLFFYLQILKQHIFVMCVWF